MRPILPLFCARVIGVGCIGQRSIGLQPVRFCSNQAKNASRWCQPRINQSWQALPHNDLRAWAFRNRQQFSTSIAVHEEAIKPETPQTPLTPQKPPSKPAVRQEPETPDGREGVPQKDLPSHRERQRWHLSKRLSSSMDDMQAKLAIAGQTINNYTGTDYSGIEALRREIKKQEQVVQQGRLSVEEAKQALDAAHAEQGSFQKEVVGLLERKHSWSATDLERYMALIRSEHKNDQAVRIAKDNVLAAELALEEARTQLERRERAQYHEEQIWSDTIRRNSTWVTIVLMGFNAFLLLLSMIILEPWRRRRMVKEIRSALDDQNLASTPNTPLLTPTLATEKEIATVVEPSSESLETIEADDARSIGQETKTLSPITDANIPSIPTGAPGITGEPVLIEGDENMPTAVSTPTLHQPLLSQDWRSRATNGIWDLFSDRNVSLQMVQVTAIAIEGAAVGAALAGILFALFGSR